MIEYKSYRFVDNKARWVVVNKNGKVINKNPSKDELRKLERLVEKDGRGNSRPHQKYTDEYLLDCLIQFEKENGRPPREKEFTNSRYPTETAYRKSFGSWTNSLLLAGLDVDLMGRQGDKYRGRKAEIIVVNHFKNKSTDLSGENQNSPYDGICPNGMIYDVKGSKFHAKRCQWSFGTNNKFRDDIEIYYFLAFNEDWTKLEYAWRVPGDIVDRDIFHIGLSDIHEFNVYNMEEYDITDKIMEILKENKCDQ